MQIKKIDLVFIIIIILITFISIDFIINESHREIIENISKYPPFQNLGLGLLITFLVCLIGNLIPFPTPYTFVLCFSSLPFLNLNVFIPFIIALIASLGSLIGELGGYILGRGISGLISDETFKNLRKYQKFLVNHPSLAPILIFIFGLTPLNDDLITVPLGIIRYSLKKTIFWCWLGKLGLMLIFSYNLINICSLLGGENWILSILTLYILTFLMYLIIKVDIIEYCKKLFRIKNNKNP